MPPTIGALSTLLDRVGRVLANAINLGKHAQANCLSLDDAISLGTVAQGLLTEVQATATGIAATTLLPSGARPQPPPSHGVRQRTWAEVASHAQDPSHFRQNEPNLPSKLAGTVAGAPNSQDRELQRCITLEPTKPSQRNIPTACARFADELEGCIKEIWREAPTRIVELIWRTRRGGYQVQIFGQYFSQIEACLRERTISLPHFGDWTMTQTREGGPRGATLSLVVQGIPIEVTDEQFIRELHLGNEGRFSKFRGQAFRTAIHSVTRLSRRIPSATGNGSWAPSRTMRLVVAKNVGEAILARGTLVLCFRSVPVRLYHLPIRTCFRCGREGHEARFCRSAAKCRNCGQGHAVWDCPQPRVVRGVGTSAAGGSARSVGEGTSASAKGSGRTDLPPPSW